MTAIITYSNRDGDAPVVHWFETRFAHGEPVETDNPELIAKARTHPAFEVLEDGVTAPSPRPRGRPRKVTPDENAS